uniref:3'-5' exonuclease domain-containing protein n=1 Tax=Pinguiococcus pyrenoidosus TaxID=172671 RepID=A0A7R9YFF2_9STRA|mmetsp:Transcript_8198/g.30800  ORF Transcript_8198/g.30800 Transcript_8198/m.30800 type:complete len:709 (+) Transcript_8198:250-2376(+)
MAGATPAPDMAALVRELLTSAGSSEDAVAMAAVQQYTEAFQPPKAAGMFAAARRSAIEAMKALAEEQGSLLPLGTSVMDAMTAISSAPPTGATGPATMCLVASFQTVAKEHRGALAGPALHDLVRRGFSVVISNAGAKDAKKALGKLSGCLCDLAGLTRIKGDEEEKEGSKGEEETTEASLRETAKEAINALLSCEEYTAAVQLAEGAGVVGRNMESAEILHVLLQADKVEQAAMLLESTTAQEDPAAVIEGKKQLIQHLLSAPGKAGHAMHYIARYHLEHDFPESLNQRASDEIAKLMGKGKLPLAIRIATKKGGVEHRQQLLRLYLDGGGSLESAERMIRDWQDIGKFPDDLSVLGDDPVTKRLMDFINLTAEYNRVRQSLERQISGIRDVVEAARMAKFLTFGDFRAEHGDVFRGPFLATGIPQLNHALQILQQMFTSAKQRNQVPIFVGIDTETRFIEYGRSELRPALLQFAYGGRVILFDLLMARAIAMAPERIALEAAISCILYDPAVILLGVGVQEDVKGILRTIHPAPPQVYTARLLDLEKAHNALKKMIAKLRPADDVDALITSALRDALPPPAGMMASTQGIFDSTNPEGVGGGLGGLCYRYLGKKLMKWQQLTDWEARPLTLEQVEYATLDALVAPSILEQIIKLWTYFGGDPSELIASAELPHGGGSSAGHQSSPVEGRKRGFRSRRKSRGQASPS